MILVINDCNLLNFTNFYVFFVAISIKYRLVAADVDSGGRDMYLSPFSILLTLWTMYCILFTKPYKLETCAFCVGCSVVSMLAWCSARSLWNWNSNIDARRELTQSGVTRRYSAASQWAARPARAGSGRPGPARACLWGTCRGPVGA